MKMSQIQDIQKVAKSMAETVIAHMDSIQPLIFIMGPDMSMNCPAATLRREIKKRCDKIGLPVIPEHPIYEKEGKKALGKEFNWTSWELIMAQSCHVVIIIPASPGSFAEFGLFCMVDDICPRMLVIFHKDHKGEDSYLQQGPQKAARKRSATIRFLDYSDIDKVWRSVSSYVSVKRSIMLDQMTIRRG